MAMRKVFYGLEGILLKHMLRVYDKQSLLNYACPFTPTESGWGDALLLQEKSRSACVKIPQLI